MYRLRTIFTLGLLPVLLAACLFESPQRGAKELFNAAVNMDGNKMMERTCAAQRAQMQEVGAITTAVVLLPQLFGLHFDIEGDVSDVHFTTLVENETDAQVRVHGQMRVAILAFVQEVPIDETWFMVLEDGKWRYCGSQQAQ